MRVRRIRVGDPLECVDDAGHRYAGRVIGRGPGEVVVALETATSTDTPRLPITLAQALIKPDRFAWALQKATELGVARLIPLITARSVVRVRGEQVPGHVARWERIVREAVKQCGRATIPTVEPPRRVSELMEWLSDWSLVLMPTLAIPARPLREAVTELQRTTSVLILIGPEGDFTAEEAQVAQRHRAVPVSLGPLTLRSETAAAATLAIVQYAAGIL